MNFILNFNKCSIKEIPIKLPARTYGHSKMRFKDAWHSLKLLIILFIRTITDREQFRSLRLGLEIAVAYERLHPGKIDWNANLKLIGNKSVIESIKKLEDPRLLFDRLDSELAPFMEKRRKYLLY